MRRIQEAFLAGAYSTGLADAALIDLENPRPSLTSRIASPCGRYALRICAPGRHPLPRCSPSPAAAGPDLSATGYSLTRRRPRSAEASLYPWRLFTGDTLVDGVPRTRLFGPSVKAARALRTEREALRAGLAGGAGQKRAPQPADDRRGEPSAG